MNTKPGKAGVVWILSGVITLTVLAVLACLLIGGDEQASAGTTAASAGESIGKRVRKTRKTVRKARPKPRPAVKPKIVLEEEDDGLTPEERKLSRSIRDALDNDDRDALHALIEDVRKSPNPQIRRDFVDALGWFGKSSIGDLAAFLCDGDADVRESAGDRWQTALSEFDDDIIRVEIVEETLKTVDDERLIELIAAEYNGMDEKLAIESIIRVMVAGRYHAVQAAKQAYEFITGDEYTSAADAREWIENYYVPPEGAEGGGN